MLKNLFKAKKLKKSFKFMEQIVFKMLMLLNCKAEIISECITSILLVN